MTTPDPGSAHERVLQGSDAEHLRRLRQPMQGALGRLQNPPIAGELERVGNRVRQQPAHCIAKAGVDQAVGECGCHQAAHCIVYQHPVLARGSAFLQGVQSVEDRLGAAGAAARNTAPGMAVGRRKTLQKQIAA